MYDELRYTIELNDTELTDLLGQLPPGQLHALFTTLQGNVRREFDSQPAQALRAAIRDNPNDIGAAVQRLQELGWQITRRP